MNKLSVNFTHDGEGWDVSVVVDGKEVEAGCLVQHPAHSDWVSLVLRYIDHRLCTACPDASTAKRPSSSTPGNRPAARRPTSGSTSRRPV